VSADLGWPQGKLRRTIERPMPLYEYMVLASSFDAARTVIRCPLLSSYSRHCNKQMFSPKHI